ncbi:ABC transporter permease [Devosia sp. 2618]|uniref:ABC transporter permease n=1 Tax=Devosia sp. 2618 TaxID=3156454 RepID=UPI0033989020
MRELFQRLAGSPAGFIAGGFILLLILITIIVPLIYSVNPMAISSNALFPPSPQHLLGTDELGRDVLQLLIHGVRVSLSVGLISALVASVLGVLIGAWAGYFGGRIDMFLMRVAEIFQVLPTFVLAAVIVAMLGPGTTRVIAVIAILAWPQIALVMRSEVYRVKQIDFVDAVRCLGYSEIYILVREVVPNALRSVVALGTLIVGQAILIEASLSFLGLSSPDVISWGGMLNSGQRYLFNAWWLSVLPGIAIFLTVLAFNFVGDALNAALNPKDTGR